MVEFKALSDEYHAALGEAAAAQQTAKEKTATKDAKRLLLEAGLTARGKYVDLKSSGDKAKILSSGFDVAGERTPPVAPGTVTNLALTAGDAAGELELQWDPEAVANHYEVQLCPDTVFGAGVINLPSVTRSKATATGLTSGSRIWARVRALNSAGVGAWSDPATKIVP